MNPFGRVAPFFAILAMYSSLSFWAWASFCASVASAGFSSCPCGPLASAGFSSALASAGFAFSAATTFSIQVPNFLSAGWYASLCLVAKYLLPGAV